LDVIMKYANGQETYLEQLSALADGELDSAQAQALVSTSRTDTQLLHSWASYHAIGDVLRAHASDAHAATARAAPATRSASAAQPGVQVVASAKTTAANLAPAPALLAIAPQAAANDSVWRWKLVAGVAALAAVGSVLWSVVGQQGGPAGAQLAQRSSPAPAIVAGAQEVAAQGVAAQGTTTQGVTTQEGAPVMIRDPRLDELLAAHKQFGGASALQQPAGFLRNATFTPTGR
jgi:sigma-E factor negative regulatory protein RseA